MAASVEKESEIILDNKHLLAVFAVVAVLLAVAFTGGYMLGKGSAEKKVVAGDGQTTEGASALVPRTVTPDDSYARADAAPPKPDSSPTPQTEELKPVEHTAPAAPPVAAVKHPVVKTEQALPLGSHPIAEGTPHTGQTFVQVAALTHTEAVAMADVLRKQHFSARVAPKPGSTTVFRVLVGPTKDPAEITATRDALRKIGFREVIVQRY